MQLPRSDSAAAVHTRFASYVFRRLSRAEQVDLAAAVRTVDDKQLATSREIEDLERPVSEALAERDAIDDDLVETARLARLDLAGRSPEAVKQAPYTTIFPESIEHYISATLSDQSERYRDLVSRMEAHLPADDAVRTRWAPALTTLRSEWEVAVGCVDDARNALGRGRTRRDEAIEAWEITMERVYGTLVTIHGKTKAERFFPKIVRRRGETDADDAPQTH